MPRYQLEQGKWGIYFHDSKRNIDMPLDHVLNKLNRCEELTIRLGAISKAADGKDLKEVKRIIFEGQ